jgi:signal transduction histidine kinase
MTIRLRLTLYYSGLLVILLSMFGMAVFLMLRWTMLNQVDTTLHRVLEEVLEDTGGRMEIGPDGELLLTAYVPRLDTFRTPGVYVQIWEVYSQQQLFSSSENLGMYMHALDENAIGAPEEVRSDVSVNGTHLRVITQPITIEGQVVGNVQAAASMSTIESATDRLLKILLGGGLIALLLSLLMGDWLARRALRPVESIVATAQSITAADDLGRRIPYTGPPEDELGRMVTAFNATLGRLDRLFRAQRRFVGDVSHELRSPLTSIQGNVDLVRLYGSDPKSIEAIESEVARMSRMIDDLLLLAQADAGQIPVEMEALELDQLLLEIYNESGMYSKGMHVLKLGEFEQVSVLGNADRLKQLFTNLVTNAIKYTPKGGAITLALQQKSDGVYVSVSDTGLGIPEEDLSNIYDRFYRVDKHRSRAMGGAGLGLSIVKWIADVHHARVDVQSEVGKGTTFTVILPIITHHVESDAEEMRSRFMPIKLL